MEGTSLHFTHGQLMTSANTDATMCIDHSSVHCSSVRRSSAHCSSAMYCTRKACWLVAVALLHANGSSAHCSSVRRSSAHCSSAMYCTRKACWLVAVALSHANGSNGSRWLGSLHANGSLHMSGSNAWLDSLNKWLLVGGLSHALLVARIAHPCHSSARLSTLS
jgi:hypothetical protein